MLKAVLLDYGAGNLHSLGKALEVGGAEVRLESDPARILDGDVLVLPGVGAFGVAAAHLSPVRDELRAALEDGFPCLGVCLGMQLLFERSEEAPELPGIGLIRGGVRRLRGARVPHMGWNDVVPAHPAFRARNAMTLRDIPLVAYFANSFVAEGVADGDVLAWTSFGNERFPAAVRYRRTLGVQFHPEKSGIAGIRLIVDFLGALRT